MIIICILCALHDLNYNYQTVLRAEFNNIRFWLSGIQGFHHNGNTHQRQNNGSILTGHSPNREGKTVLRIDEVIPQLIN
jgi:hypothetical protein